MGSISLKGRLGEWLPTLVVVGSILVIAAVSALSGYTSSAVPAESLWPFTPLGLIFSFPHEALSLGNECLPSAAPGLSMDYAAVFLWTCLLEAPFYWVALRGSKLINRAAVLFAANLATHPMVFFAFPCAFAKYLTSLLYSEVFAAGAEVGLILLINKTFDLGLSPRWLAGLIVAANLFSWQVGIYTYG